KLLRSRRERGVGLAGADLAHARSVGAPQVAALGGCPCYSGPAPSHHLPSVPYFAYPPQHAFGAFRRVSSGFVRSGLLAAALERQRGDLVLFLRSLVGALQRLLLLGDVRPRRCIGRCTLQVLRPRGRIELADFLGAADQRVDVLVDAPLGRQLAL